jgi:hypothetical protein
MHPDYHKMEGGRKQSGRSKHDKKVDRLIAIKCFSFLAVIGCGFAWFFMTGWNEFPQCPLALFHNQWTNQSVCMYKSLQDRWYEIDGECPKQFLHTHCCIGLNYDYRVSVGDITAECYGWMALKWSIVVVAVIGVLLALCLPVPQRESAEKTALQQLREDPNPPKRKQRQQRS